jgi:hypothetical protein
MKNIIVATLLLSTPAFAEVVVTFNRELPNETVEFSRTFQDKDDFEMWLQNRLEGPGCDPYLKDMRIQFKTKQELD